LLLGNAGFLFKAFCQILDCLLHFLLLLQDERSIGFNHLPKFFLMLLFDLFNAGLETLGTLLLQILSALDQFDPMTLL